MIKIKLSLSKFLSIWSNPSPQKWFLVPKFLLKTHFISSILHSLSMLSKELKVKFQISSIFLLESSFLKRWEPFYPCLSLFPLIQIKQLIYLCEDLKFSRQDRTSFTLNIFLQSKHFTVFFNLDHKYFSKFYCLFYQIKT